MPEKLALGEIEDDCSVCYVPTKWRATCCSVVICEECYLKWLQVKRQCMVCRQDQCSFETWLEKYKVDQDEDVRDDFFRNASLDELRELSDGVISFVDNVMARLQTNNPMPVNEMESMWDSLVTPRTMVTVTDSRILLYYYVENDSDSDGVRGIGAGTESVSGDDSADRSDSDSTGWIDFDTDSEIE